MSVGGYILGLFGIIFAYIITFCLIKVASMADIESEEQFSKEKNKNNE